MTTEEAHMDQRMAPYLIWMGVRLANHKYLATKASKKNVPCLNPEAKTLTAKRLERHERGSSIYSTEGPSPNTEKTYQSQSSARARVNTKVSDMA